jgi:thymidylate synthase ThyX
LPEVRLVAAFPRPFENAVATARTCYSAKGIVTEAEVSGDRLEDEAKREARRARRDELARDIYRAGHHTTLQHAHFQFALSNVSRQFLWSFLHSHPFYNSEQVSQRYVEVRSGAAFVPPLEGEAREIYERALEDSFASYRRLDEALRRPVSEAWFRVFPGRASHPDRWEGAIRKRTQEVARYVLPVATFAWLYHTVSGLTLLRYWRVAESGEVPFEQRLVVGRMVEALLAHDPLYRVLLEEPIPAEESPEARFFASRPAPTPAETRAFRAEFDRSLGGRSSLLVGGMPGASRLVADAVREVLGLTEGALPDGEALLLVLDPARNPVLGETLNLSPHDRITRAIVHAGWSFRKKLSHSADSQDQRHRATPASRPRLAAAVAAGPDVVVPTIVAADPVARAIFDEAVERGWEAAQRIETLTGSSEWGTYLLPNATAIRFTESGDLSALRHKLAMRLCWNAQEEIWRASVDEAGQILEVEPEIGRWLLPPCSLRQRGGTKPICPEGERFCGVPVWRLGRGDWKREI